MDRAEKAARIAEVLDGLFPQPAIPLCHEDPFTLLVATVLSARTTDAKVNQVTPALFARAPDPAALAALLVERHGGCVPASFEALEALPGVGHKTASVVMAGAFGRPTFPVDTHVHRLVWRWGLSDGTSVARTERDLKACFPEARWYPVHLQMIYFGRRFCQALRHVPAACPICSWAGVAERQEAPRGPG